MVENKYIFHNIFRKNNLASNCILYQLIMVVQNIFDCVGPNKMIYCDDRNKLHQTSIVVVCNYKND